MTFKYAVGRVHLYLGMILVPWILIYAVSSLVINHGPLVRQIYNDKRPEQKEILNQSYDRPVSGNTDLKKLGRLIMDDLGFRGGFHIRRLSDNRIQINNFSFKYPVRIIYYLDEKRVTADRTNFRLDQFLIRMHILGGYIWNSTLFNFWAFIVDIFCLGMVAWVVTGIYMWWHIPETRKWGVITICSGTLLFLFLII